MFLEVEKEALEVSSVRERERVKKQKCEEEKKSSVESLQVC